MKRKSSYFIEKISANIRKKDSEKGYLRLPKGVQLFKEEPGEKVFLDFVPYKVTDPYHLDKDEKSGVAVPGAWWYKKPFRVHRSVGVKNETLVCPLTFGKKCPICEYMAHQLKNKVKWDNVKHLRPSARSLYLVIPKGHKKYEERIHVWDISDFCFYELLEDELREDESYKAFPDLKEGYTLRIRFGTECIGEREFAKAKRIDFIERDYEYDEESLNIPNLDEVLVVLGYEELKMKFFEIEDDVIASETDEEIVEEDEIEEETKDKGNYIKEKEVPTVRKKKKVKENKEKEETSNRTVDDENPRNRCPYGHRFGIDIDEYDDCDNCELWDECADAER